MSQGRIIQIIGAVIDVEFDRHDVPKVYDALKVDNSETTLEVQRQRKIEEGLSAAERAKADLASAGQTAEQEIAAAKAKAAQLIDQANRSANQMLEDARLQAAAEGERIRQQAHDAVDQEINKAREDLRKQVAELAVLGAQKILQQQVDPAAHAKMLDELAAQL